MVRTAYTESKYVCPCGFSFIQTDSQTNGKLKIIRRLHAKKCETAKEVNKILTPQYATHMTSQKNMTKEILKKQKEFLEESIYRTLQIKNENVKTNKQ